MLYAIVSLDTNRLVPSYPDMSDQGGCSAINGNQPVIELFRNKRIAQAYCVYLRMGDWLSSKSLRYVVKKVTVTIHD